MSANDRDAIQELKDAALRSEFEILLVFMFDRIGRIDDETPFVVEWFVKHGIKVWSVKEGEQRFDNHVDKLTNYIRFWQASGESEKTSMRIKTRIQQLTLEGVFTGGQVPYGYRLVKRGRINKRGNEISDIEVNPEEAETIRFIFSKTVTEGCGSYTVARMLNEKGLRTHNGSKFQSNTIIRILRNLIYCGYLKAGEVVSPRISELVIINDDVYEKAQYILAQRATKNTEKREISLTNRGKALLSGVAYCAYCGGRLTTTRYQDKYTRKDGSVYKVDEIKYYCYHKGRKLNDCDGQTTYSAEKVDAVVMEFMKNIFGSIKGCPEEEKLQLALKQQVAGNLSKQKRLKIQLDKDNQQLDKLQLEIGKALIGDSVYTSEDLSVAIKALKQRISDIGKELSLLCDEEQQKKLSTEKIIPAYKQFKSWGDEFEKASFEAKKMIACQLFKRVGLGKNYEIGFELNMTYSQFCEEWLEIEKVDLIAS